MVTRTAGSWATVAGALLLTVAVAGCSSGGSSATTSTIPSTSRPATPQERTAITKDVPPPAGAEYAALWMAKSAANYGVGTTQSKGKTQYVFVHIDVPGVKWSSIASGGTPAAGCGPVPSDIMKELFPSQKCA